MLAGVQEDQHVHLSSQIDGVARLGIARDEAHGPIVRDVDPAKEVHVRHQVTRPKTPLAKLHQETVAAILVIVVAVLLITRRAVFGLDDLAVGRAANRIMPADTVASLSAAIAKALADDTIRDRFLQLGAVLASPEEMTPRGFGQFFGQVAAPAIGGDSC